MGRDEFIQAMENQQLSTVSGTSKPPLFLSCSARGANSRALHPRHHSFRLCPVPCLVEGGVGSRTVGGAL